MNKFIKLAFSTAFVVGLASCLKDKNYDDNVIGHNLDGVPKVIELGFINNPSHSTAVALDFVDAAVKPTMFFVRLAANEVASEDITVTLDTTGAQAKISAAGRTLLPASFYTYETPSFKVVIPKGARESLPFRITTNAIRYNPSTTYGLYFKTVSVDKSGYNISENFGEFITTFGAKNKYDGIYEVTGTFSHVNPAFTGNYPRTYHLITTGASSVDVNQNINASMVPGYLFLNNGGGSFFGNFGVSMTFDPVTNAIIEMHNYYGDPTKAANGVGTPSAGTGAPLYAASNGRRVVIDPSGINTYDNGVIKMKFFMVQPSANPNGPAGYFDETLTYVGPR